MRAPRLLIVLFIFISVFAEGQGTNAQTESGQKVFNLQVTKEPVRIGHYVEFYRDKSGAMPFEEVRKQKEFFPKDAVIANFNVTSDAIWGRAKFTCQANANWYFRLDPADFNEIVFYQQRNRGPWQEERTGNMYRPEERRLAINHFLFRLDLTAGDTLTVFFKVQDYYPLQFDMFVGTLEAFVEPAHNSDLYNGVCYGIMIMMLIYNFYLFLTQRTVVYLYYMLYVLFSLVFSAFLGGYALHFPWAVIKLIQFAPIIPPACFGIFGLLFTLRLFGNTMSGGFRRLVYIFIAIASGDILLSAIPATVYLSENIIQPLGLILAVLSISAAIIALRKKHSSARYYLIGFGAYMLSLFYIIMAAQGLVELNNFTWHALVTGSAIESIMLSFALGDKMKVSLLEKEKAQREALAQATENERLVKEQNIMLERKVRERTLELEEKNKEILDSIEYASRIQRALITSESYIGKTLTRMTGAAQKNAS